MARFIQEDKVLEVQQATDIVELISEYIPLKKAGVNYKALCPFHDEKTPSFVVSPGKQIYHCFGCHKGGNVFSFLMGFEKLEFPEAVRHLADRSGIHLVMDDKGQYPRDKRADLIKLNRQVADQYHRQLLESKEGEAGRAYLEKRGFKQSIIARFLLGYALPSWDGLLSYARRSKWREDYLAELGLILKAQRKERWYDRFRGRLIFPIFNTRDRVVGFGGRILEEGIPVYLNSPESALFNKGKGLYGLNFAKGPANKKGELWVVEGYTDVLMAHQHGFEWVVATLGTALTTDHIKTIRRFVNKVVIVYDADTAGQIASARTLDMFLAEEVDLYIAQLPEGLDPYDCLVKKGPDVFEKCVQGAKSLFDYRLDLVRRKYDVTQVDGKVKAVDEIVQGVTLIPNVFKRDLLVKKISEDLNVKQSVIQTRIKELSRPRRAVRATEPGAAVSARMTVVSPKDTKLGENIVEIMIEHNEFIPEVQKTLNSADFPTPESSRVAQEIFRVYERYGKVSLDTLLSFIAADQKLADWLVGISERGSMKDVSDAKRYLNDCFRVLEEKHSQLVIKTSLKKKMKDAEVRGDEKEFNALFRKLQELQTSLSKGRV